ncbi:hypothetical protein [Terrabacter sp. Soil810]|uniref:hypothetical protein n=1 Tax=Terrabacter sp. Soil810 TaxID=1736418 RepID=UPI00070969D5|nr:hypothetical protein [Terrabacter sp. Soil810]KRF47024.1 hypothetical protein ASG96_03160 [Terrabacter sp. Soil810]
MTPGVLMAAPADAAAPPENAWGPMLVVALVVLAIVAVIVALGRITRRRSSGKVRGSARDEVAGEVADEGADTGPADETTSDPLPTEPAPDGPQDPDKPSV